MSGAPRKTVSPHDALQQRQEALKTLRLIPGAVYAVLDSARDERVLAWLRRAQAPYRSLYEGPEAQALENVAPYLVDLTRQPTAREGLISAGWSRSWGVFLAAAKPFDDVRRHLRRFLLVREEGSDKTLYFRFYDPRVLRCFLPVCSPEQQAALYTDIDCFFCEAEDGGLLRFPRPAGARHHSP